MANQIPVHRSGTPFEYRRFGTGDTLHVPGDALIDGDLTVGGIITGSLEITPLSADENIYVDTAGNDTTGDGSIGNPYLTIHRAAKHYNQLNPGNFSVIVHINAGVHSVTSTFSFLWGYGSSLRWEGSAENVATPTISSISASATTGSAPYAGLEYIEFNLDLSAATPDPVAGQFVRMTGCTGGTNPDGLNGLHEIMSVAAGVATCRVWRVVGTTELPSGAITVASATLIRSVLKFTTNAHGIDIKSPVDMGDWDGIVIRGNDSAVSGSKRAIRLFNGAGIRASSVSGTFGVFFYEWSVALEIVGGSSAYFLRSSTAKITGSAFTADTFGGILASGTSTWNGVAGATLLANNGSVINATSGVIQSCGTASGTPVQAQTNGFINATSMRIHYDQGGVNAAIFARDLGMIQAEGVTVVGFTNMFNPLFPFGNDYGLILRDSEIGVQPSKTIAGYGAGTAYTVTNSSAEVNRGTTDSVITIDQAGTYLIHGHVTLAYNAATFASGTITLKLRRTNNTAADVANSSVGALAFVLTTFTGGIELTTPPVVYTTTNTNDTVALFIDVSAGPTAGSLTVEHDSIIAERVL